MLIRFDAVFFNLVAEDTRAKHCTKTALKVGYSLNAAYLPFVSYHREQVAGIL